VVFFPAYTSAQESRPKHLDLAIRFVRQVAPENTSYRHKDTSVRWKGVRGAPAYESHTDCSGFLDALLRHTYGLNDESMKQIFGSRRPLAKAYYEAIQTQHGFRRIDSISAILPGDIIAVKYRSDDPENKDHNTGHVMLVAEAPATRPATPPLAKETRQWEVVVIDQSHSGHGPKDTRHRQGHKDASGLGEGILRIYARKDGSLAGYSWSTLKNSEFHGREDREIVIGRFQQPAQ
jgi:hypothetical protein